MVPGLSNKSYPERLMYLKLPTLAYRRTRGDMIQVYKLMNGGYDDALPPLLKRNTNTLRGNTKKLFLEQPNKNIRKYNFNFRVCNLWNSLPEHLVKAKDVRSFEKGLDNHWKNQDQMFMDYKAEIKIRKSV